MPRGGGGFRGGFRSGGFGGGFRGGGFRGGPSSFRMGSVRSSGRPFGRTGATRIVNRGPRGPYSHRYYRPHRRYYYGHWYRPWYWRWWYSPWWAGYWYRPWYYSPVYIIGGITTFILIALIILPVLGVALLFPFNGADPTGIVNYRSVETLYFNEYWYEYEYIKQGGEITFSVQSSPSLISFAIWDQPFESLPTTKKSGSFSDQFTLQNDEYQYYSLFLRPDSTFDFSFTASNSIDFFIADVDNLIEWNEYGTPSFYIYEDNTQGETGTFLVQQAQDYYLVWYNEGTSNVNIQFTVDYIAADVEDLSEAEYYVEGVDFIPETTITVPNDGNWYFFVYFDPMNSPEESTEITFDVSYSTGVSSTDRWISIQPILIAIIVIVIVVVIIAFIARKSQKKLKTTAPPKTTPTTTTAESNPYLVSECPKCGNALKSDAHYCYKCGNKIEGRQIGTAPAATPKKSKICSFCGSDLSGAENYCKYCGAKVSK